MLVLHSGSRSGLIHQHDVRVADHHIFTFGGHTQEVCGLTWSPDGKYLASGGNDNMVYIWPMTTGSEYQAIHALSEHQGAVKVTWIWKDVNPYSCSDFSSKVLVEILVLFAPLRLWHGALGSLAFLRQEGAPVTVIFASGMPTVALVSVP